MTAIIVRSFNPQREAAVLLAVRRLPIRRGPAGEPRRLHRHQTLIWDARISHRKIPSAVVIIKDSDEVEESKHKQEALRHQSSAHEDQGLAG